MTAQAVYWTTSPGWGGVRIAIGRGQKRALQQLIASIRHKSRRWHRAPTMRGFGVSSSTAHGWLHSLHERGAIAIDTTRGCLGETLFTLNPRYWHRGPVRRGMLARFTAAPGQLALMAGEPETVPLFPDAGGLVPPEPPASQPPPIVAPPERAPVPQRDPALAGESFAEKMRRHGLDEATFWKTGWK